MKNNPLTRAQHAVLAALRDQPDLVEIEALGRHLGRHPNTLRDHLATLIEAGLVVRHTPRFPLFHAKDGVINPQSGLGYDMVPFGTGDIDYRRFFTRVGAKNRHHPMVEQDTAPSATVRTTIGPASRRSRRTSEPAARVAAPVRRTDTTTNIAAEPI